MALAGTFLCHTDKSALCRGWLEVHENNMAVRLAMFQVEWTEANRKPTSMPLHKSGTSARQFGLMGIPNPNSKARRAIAKLLNRK